MNLRDVTRSDIVVGARLYSTLAEAWGTIVDVSHTKQDIALRYDRSGHEINFHLAHLLKWCRVKDPVIVTGLTL